MYTEFIIAALESRDNTCKMFTDEYPKLLSHYALVKHSGLGKGGGFNDFSSSRFVKISIAVVTSEGSKALRRGKVINFS